MFSIKDGLTQEGSTIERSGDMDLSDALENSRGETTTQADETTSEGGVIGSIGGVLWTIASTLFYPFAWAWKVVAGFFGLGGQKRLVIEEPIVPTTAQVLYEDGTKE